MAVFLIVSVAFIILVAIVAAVFSCLPNSSYDAFENASSKDSEEGDKKGSN